MKLSRMTGYIGAELHDADPTDPVLRDLLAEHLVLVLRGANLDLPAQKALTRIFGTPMVLPYVEPTEDDPEVIAVLKEADERTGVFGGSWHSDFSFLPNPPAGSILSAVELPPFGGDTVWTSCVAAYQTLPRDLKAVVDGRKVIHLGAPYGVKHAPPEDQQVKGAIRMTRGDPSADRETLHPAVVTHPVTGARALFMNPTYTTRLDGLTESESKPVLDAIYAHMIRPDFQCRLRWGPGDVAIWDNRMTLHYATNDYDGYRRLMYRTTFAGVPPA